MFVKWAIIKLITMHLAMPADIVTKAVDLETAHEDAERDDEHLAGNTAKLTRLVKASTDTLSLMA